MMILMLILIEACALATPRDEQRSAPVVYVDAKQGFVVIGKGKNDGIEPGTEFEIVRTTNTGTVKLGKAKCEKFLGKDSMAKLVVVEGDLGDIRVEDQALYEPARK